MYELIVERNFKATHALRLYDGAMESVHEHDWRVVVTVSSAGLDAIDVVVDFHALEGWLDGVIEPMCGACLNELKAFASCNPSAERVAERVAMGLGEKMPEGVRLVSVAVTEAPGCVAVYRPSD